MSQNHPIVILGDPGAEVGARESLNGQKNIARRKVKNGEKSSSRRSLVFFVLYFSTSLDFPSPPLSAPGSRRMAYCKLFLRDFFVFYVILITISYLRAQSIETSSLPSDSSRLLFEQIEIFSGILTAYLNCKYCKTVKGLNPGVSLIVRVNVVLNRTVVVDSIILWLLI